MVWGGWCCPAERGSKAPGSKYLPRNTTMKMARKAKKDIDAADRARKEEEDLDDDDDLAARMREHGQDALKRAVGEGSVSLSISDAESFEERAKEEVEWDFGCAG